MVFMDIEVLAVADTTVTFAAAATSAMLLLSQQFMFEKILKIQLKKDPL
jgi:SOS response regulatory protein OraA/RecX